jgi:hypothetical protein
VVQPWHFITALLLCLAAAHPRARIAALLITGSGLLYHAGGWIWDHPWPDPQWTGWMLSGVLLSGPVLASLVLVASLPRLAQPVRRDVSSAALSWEQVRNR